MKDSPKKSVKATARKAVMIADRVHESRWFERAARAGFAVNGLLHILIGALAIAIAVGAPTGDGDADPGGAISAVADSPGGFILVWILAAGLAMLALWLLMEAVLAHFLRSEFRRGVVETAKALTYGALAVPAVTVGLGGRVDTDDDVREISALLVQSTAGIVLLAVAGVAVIVVGGYFVVKGFRARFLDDIRTPSGSMGTVVTVLGTAGYIAKAIALAGVGVLLIVTAITVDPTEAGGLDDALRAFVELPFGGPVLLVIAVGLIMYGIYCVVRARRSTI